MSHAVVIGIDGYAGEWLLDGAVGDALDFARWLVVRGKVRKEELRLLLAPKTGRSVELPAELAGAETWPADNTTILEMVTSIVDHPPAGGGTLYFYFSGHGCSAPVTHFDQEPVLVPKDYENPRTHFNRLLPLSVIIPELAKAGGFAEQFFFIDACRDFVPPGMLPGLLAGGGLSARIYDGPNQYVLYATSPGQKAEERGRGVWTRHLLESLRGAHGALVASPTGGTEDDGPCYQVRFRPLAEYVEKQIRDDVQRRYPHDWHKRIQVPQYKPGPRPHDPVLATFDPADVAPLAVSVLVDPRSALPTCRLRVHEFRPGGARFAPLHEFDPPAERPKVLQLPINHYRFEGDARGYRGITKPVHLTRSQTVKLELAAVEAPAGSRASPRIDPVTGLSEEDLQAALGRLRERGAPLSCGVGEEMVEATRSTRSVRSATPPRGPVRDEASLVLRTADPAARIVLLDAAQQPVDESSGSEARGGREVRFNGLAPGLYQAELHLPEGRAGGEAVILEAGERGDLDLAADEVEGPEHLRYLLGQLGYDERTGYAQPGGSLGAVALPRLVSLLSFAALANLLPLEGSRQSEASFARLRQALPLPPFSRPPAAGLTVLAGSAVAEPAQGLDARRFIQHCRCVVLRPGEEEPAVAGRGTFRSAGEEAARGTAAEWQVELEEAGPLVVELRFPHFAAVRYPVVALPGHQTVLAAVVGEGGAVEIQQHVLPLEGMPDPSLLARRLRRLDLAERLAARGDFLAVLEALDGPDLRCGEWLDPIAGALLGYALLRVDKTGDLASIPLFSMLPEAFPALPDAHVLAGLAHPDEQDHRFAAALATGGLPVFFDGLQALAAWASEPSPLLAEALVSGLIPGAAWSAWRAIQPLLPVQNDRFAVPPPVWQALEKRRPEVEKTLRSVGRIELEGPGAAAPFVGTGFLVAPGVLMTASFVAGTFLQRLDQGPRRGTWTLREGVQARVDFREERGQTAPAAEVRISGVLAVDEAARIALLTLEESAAEREPLVLGRIQEGLETIGRPVYVVSYPTPDFRAQAPPVLRILAVAPGTKRLQPGEIVGSGGGELYHDCLTALGSAGAPLVDLETGLVLGVHQSGLQTFYKSAIALSPVSGRPEFQDGFTWAELKAP